MVWWFLLAVRYTLGSFFIFPLIFLSKRLRERRLLERVNGPHSLKGRDYPYWFHVSSEGELEQVIPILKSISDGLRGSAENPQVLLLYTSPSLLKKTEKLAKDNPYVRPVMVPLLKIFWGGQGSLFSLKSPKVFFMVRYDFFPELLFKGIFSKKFILLSASLKGKMKSFKRNKFKGIYYHLILSSFSEVYAAGPQDLERIESFYNKKPPFQLFQHDFRHGQIIERQRNLENFKAAHCDDSFKSWLGESEINDRYIFGSVWPNELAAFTEDFKNALKDEKTSLRVFLAPHHLKGEAWESIEKMSEAWEQEGIKIAHWNHYGMQGEGPVVLCQVPGLLCELYPFFGHAFVGGGHGRSVHSLLEPFWGGSHIYCGPKTHRSTEFDYVLDHSPRHLHVVNELEALYAISKKAKEIPCDAGARDASKERVIESQAKFLASFFN